jgi:hypothetical protein
MKRLNLVDGAVLAHPFEIAERVQQYAKENVEEVLSIFFESYGVLGPNGDELAATIEADERYYSPLSVAPLVSNDSPFDREAVEITELLSRIARPSLRLCRIGMQSCASGSTRDMR